jgi:uncharacterized protein YaiL (DUF2058 family)
MQNLKDKLLQAGLIPKDYRAGETPEQRTARLNREQIEKRARVAEIAKAAAIKTAIGTHTFFFTTRSKKLRRLVIDDDVRLALEKGQLAVVEWPDHPAFPWAVVSREAAEKVLKIDTEALRFYVRSEKEQFGVAPSR